MTHFDLACFAWNPAKSILTKRTRGIQDRQEHLWSHLPPECYEPMYDTRMVDVWSIGTLFAFCLCGLMPFGAGSSANSTLQQAVNQWMAFKGGRHSYVFGSITIAPVTELLTNYIFVASEERINAEQLLSKLSSETFFREHPRRSPNAITGKGHGKVSRSTSRPSSCGHQSKHHQHHSKTNPRHSGKARTLAARSKGPEPKMKQKQTKK